ncbi:polyketide synthase [Aspergillus heteromorphus CBS 117.55]|uniref:Polyketide synthase n=1 Tax=Aspergillus heteromorphus CBS 117.55 TaxID=1448321 RepID=A0A317WU44_9EURO|nr:polyketide synthase [Aspergillus heteromorphus CBS 117.55]PWY89876.1 polyketide synthase [Aspergillus heteromorphus CBS 117.55]
MPAKRLPQGTPPEPIAVIGMSCRFSGEASSVEGFWEMLRQGRTGHGRVPASRYEASAWHHPSHERKGAINHDSGFFLDEDPARFDAPFFSITAKEAAGMDPAQRLLLEVAYEAFENGGVPMESLPGSSTAVFSGCMTNDYELLSTRDIYDMPHNSATGNGRTMLANRLSWFFDLRGPSVMLDTACSSSLTALHLAAQALRAGECRMALITGASLILHPNFTQRLSYMHMLSADGISHSFDIQANGYGRGEGLGAVLLKPLAQALADGDAIRAVVRATGINQDGRTPGITMPNPVAQADLIRTVYGPGLPSMRDTPFFEAHGTGTPVGDPIELTAIGETLGAARTPADEPVYVGSVKPNIGHTEGAAGVASLIKTVLCLEKGMLVPTVGVTELNPKIRLDEWRLRLNETAMPWPSHLPQRASINSFGFGGANAHAIVESTSQYLWQTSTRASPATATRTPQLVVFSTHDKAGIDRTAEKWAAFLDARIAAGKPLPLSAVAYTLAMRRSQLAFRSFAVADSAENLRDSLAHGLPGFPRASRTNLTPLAFVFTGQGAQWAGMGAELLGMPVFAESMARSQQILASLDCPWDLLAEITADAADSHINQPSRSQPICCALQIALVDLLASWGVYPRATVGHSSGEIGAAYAAGYLSHDDAIRVSHFRGVCSQQIADHGRRGGMLAAGLSASEAQGYLDPLPAQSVVVACVNSPSSVTLSGDADQIDRLADRLQADGHFARKLRVTTAYHSPHMQALAETYEQAIQPVQPQNRRQDTIVMLSSVTKERVHSADLGAAYWVRNLTSPVEFAAAVSQLATLPDASKARRRPVPVKWGCFLEIGPHEALKGPFMQTLQAVNAGLAAVPYHALVRRKEDGVQTALQVAGSIWSIGAAIDLAAVNGGVDGTAPPVEVISDLPTYPWNHQTSFWHEPVESAQLRRRREPRHDLLGAALDYHNPFEPRWRNFLRVAEMPWLADHVVAGSIVYPAAGMVGMVAEAARQLADPSQRLAGIEFQDIAFRRGMVIPPDARGLETTVHVASRAGLPGWYEFGIFSLPEGASWIQHAAGLVSLHYGDGDETRDPVGWEHTVERVQEAQGAAQEKEVQAVYEWLSQTGGVNLGPTFRSIASAAFTRDGQRLCLGGVVPDTQRIMPYERESPCFLHPTALDALFQAAVLCCSEALSKQIANIPVGVERLYLPTTLSWEAGDQFAVYTETRWENGESRSDCLASDPGWSEPGVFLQGVWLGRVPVQKKTATAVEGDDRASRYSSVVWGEHLDSAALQSGLLHKWMAQVCYTHGDARALVVASSAASDIFRSLEGVAPIVGHRPCLQQLTVVLTGPGEQEQEQEKEKARLVKTLPGAQVQVVSSLDEFDSSSLGDGLYDVVLLDHPTLWDGNALPATLASLRTITRPEGWLAVRAPPGDPLAAVARMPQPSVECPSESVEWQLKHLTEDAAFLLTRRQPLPTHWDSVINVLALHPDQIPASLVGQLEAVFKSAIRCIGLDEVSTVANQTVISLLEFHQPWVSTWTAPEMEQFRALLDARYVLWLSPVPEEGSAAQAAFGATTGLLRTLRNEVRGVALPQLQLAEADRLDAARLACGIEQVMQLTRQQEGSRAPDHEFRLEGSRLLVPRLMASEAVDEGMQTLLHGARATMARLAEDPRPLRLTQEGQWEADEGIVGVPLPAHHVEVQLQLLSVSASTSAPEARVSWMEAVGTIRQVGPSVEGLAEGDAAIVMLEGDRIATHIRVPRHAALKLPRGIDPPHAVSMPLSYTLAYSSLFDTARLEAGESVLVAGPLSQTLRATVGCALAADLRVYVAVETNGDKDAILAQYPSLEDQDQDRVLLLHSACESTIARLTHGQGVRAAICSRGGSAGRAAARCLAAGGHYVDTSGEMKAAALPDSFTDRGCTFSSLPMARILRDKPDRMHAALRLLATEKEKLLATVHAYPTYPVAHLNHALSHARDANTRVTLSLDTPDPVPIIPPPPAPVSLPEGKTYLLVGGLGTLGLALASTLVDCGARHLVFLSRSGTINPAQQDSLRRLQSHNCTTDILTCDITSEPDVHRLAQHLHSQSHSITAIIQCATNLQDSMFTNMSHNQWTQSTSPKIRGTLNLHTYFPTVSTFIALSSVASVIGNMGQANYSAGNAFLDALMLWRRRQGLAGYSINIGLVPDGSGLTDVAETPENRRKRYSHLSGTEVSVAEVQTLVRVLLQGEVDVPGQVVAGMRDDLARGDGEASWRGDRKFEHRVAWPVGGRDGEGEGGGGVSTKTLLKKVGSMDEAVPVVLLAMRTYLAKAMAADADADIVDPELPLSALGVDSLKATEVQNWVARELGAELSSFEFLGSLPVRALAEKIAAASVFVGR